MDIAKSEAVFKKDAANMDFFDASLYWDPYDHKSFVSFSSFDDFISAISSFNIKQAILTCSLGYRYDALEGNEITKKLISGIKWLHGAMILYPDLIINGNAENYISNLQSEGFVAARMFPKKYKHSMKEYCVGELLEILQNIRMPLILWHSEVDFDTVDILCERYPDLPFIIEGSDTKLLYHARDFLMLMKKHSNLYLETHNLVTFNQITDIVKKFGNQRLIFGSYFPYNTPLPSMYNIISAGIENKDKYMIAGENLRKLTGYIDSKVTL